MLTQVSITNFQSLQKVNVLLGPVTVVVGPSNTGKSALVRALQAWAFNQTGTDFISKGAKFTSITVDCGEEVTWTKKLTGGAEYTIGSGQVYTKLGTTVPPDVEEITNVHRIDIDGLKMTPQFAGQFDSPFLLTESAAKAARVIAKVTHLDVVMTAAAAANKDLRRGKQKYDSVVEQLSSRQEAAEAYLTLPERKQKLSEFAEWLQECKEAREDVTDDLEAAARLRKVEESLKVPHQDPATFQTSQAVADKALEDYYLAQALETAERLLALPVVPLEECVDSKRLIEQTCTAIAQIDLLRLKSEKIDILNKQDEEDLITVTELKASISKFDTCPTCGGLMVKG